MLRRLTVASALLIGLALGFVATADSAQAQSGPICSKFDSGLDGWGPCSWAPNVTTTTSTTGGIGKDDPYLQITDLSGASAVCSTDSKYLGNWVEKMGGCGQLCFDFKVFSSGSPPSAVTPSFTIYSGSSKATFYANFQVAIGDTSWHQKICAPIALGGTPPPSPNGHWVISGGTWNSIITNVTMVSLPIDFSSSPSEVVGYDNICMSPGGCGETPKPEVTGCLKDSKVEVKCNPDGTYTVTLSGVTFSGTDITLTSLTPGVTVTPPQQPWAATTTWTINGATPGQLVTLTANASKVGGGGEAGTDQCCSGEIKIVMPDCPKPPIDVKVDKENTPSGGQGNGFNVWVTNVGAPITFGPGELTVKDVVPAGLTINTQTSTKWTCNPLPAVGLATITCTYNLAGTLGTGAQLTDSLVFNGVITNHEQPLKNCAIVSIAANVGTDTNPSNDQSCVTVTTTKVGELIFKKQVVYVGPILLPSQVYPVTVTCGSNTTTLNLLNNVPQSIGNIPYGTSCSYVEPTPPVPPNVCPPNKTGAWTTVFAPPSPVTINAPVTNVLVTNTLTCQSAGEIVDVGIKKTGGTSPPPNVPWYGWHLTVTNTGSAIGSNGVITVSDTVPAGMTFTSATSTPPSNWSCNAPVSAGGTLICTYMGGPVTAGQVLSTIDIVAQASGSGPFAPFTNCATVGLTPASGLADTNAANNNSCVTVAKPGTCPPPMTQVQGGQCACPTGTVQSGEQCVPPPVSPPPPPPVCLPPMVPGPVAGVCVCPPGTVQKGRECMKQTTCQPPMVPGPVVGQCICQRGTVLRGGKCVKETVCISPAKSNGRGGCDCPEGMTKQGNNKCVKRERSEPRVTPRDVINGIGIIRGLGGGGSGGGGGGKGDSPRR